MPKKNNGASAATSSEGSGIDQKLAAAVIHYKAAKNSERLIKLEIEKAMRCMEEAIRKVTAQLSDEIMLEIHNVDAVLTVSTDGRKLTIAHAQGAALDTRLAKPRALLCSQILIFGHVSGQQESNLLTSLRVYEDGLCSDGRVTWSLKESDCMVTYMSNLVINHLFECDLYWPAASELPGRLQAIPVVDDEASTEELGKSCIGFECAVNYAKNKP